MRVPLRDWVQLTLGKPVRLCGSDGIDRTLRHPQNRADRREQFSNKPNSNIGVQTITHSPQNAFYGFAMITTDIVTRRASAQIIFI